MEESAPQHIVVVGLGNPGKRYEHTRHNMGALIVTALSHTLGASAKEEKRFHSLVAKGQSLSKTLHLLWPLTYMNESGHAVKAYLDFFRLKPENLIVVSDDVELPFGQLRLRNKGGSGGHNGLNSITAHVSTTEYTRLKVGVGKDLAGRSLADYVLEVFKPEELALLPTVFKKGVEALQAIMHMPFSEAANKFNANV